MRRLSVLSGALVAAGLAVAACGGSGPAASGSAPSVAVPSIAIPSIVIPSIDLSSFPIGSFAFPSFDANADPELAARFPQQVDGQPVTGVQTVNFVAFAQAFAQGDADQAAKLQALVQILSSNGFNPATLSYGTGTATVNGGTVEIQAFRAPGGSAASFVSLWPQLTAINRGTDAPPTQGQATVGGKNVITFTDSDGSVSYLYPSGDVVWNVDSSDQADVEAVFSAIQ